MFHKRQRTLVQYPVPRRQRQNFPEGCQGPLILAVVEEQRSHLDFQFRIRWIGCHGIGQVAAKTFSLL